MSGNRITLRQGPVQAMTITVRLLLGLPLPRSGAHAMIDCHAAMAVVAVSGRSSTAWAPGWTHVIPPPVSNR